MEKKYPPFWKSTIRAAGDSGGALLLTLPRWGRRSLVKARKPQTGTAAFDLDEMETKLEQALSKIDGAAR